MSETTLASGDTISPFQAMYHELYSWMENVKFPAPNGSYSGYTGANYKLELGTGRNVLALNVAASAWGASFSAYDFGGGAVAASGTQAELSFNTYYDGTNRKAKATAAASVLVAAAGALTWFYAPSVSAGSNQTLTVGWQTDASGNFFVGTNTSANPGIALNPSGAATLGNSAGSSGFTFLNILRSGTPIGSITQSGTTAVLYNTTSDKRLKANIADAPDAGHIIDAIQVRSFDWRGAPEHVTHGLVAQELVTFAPQAVKQGDSDPLDEDSDIWAVDPSKLVPLLIKELQALRARVAALEAP